MLQLEHYTVVSGW